MSHLLILLILFIQDISLSTRVNFPSNAFIKESFSFDDRVLRENNSDSKQALETRFSLISINKNLKIALSIAIVLLFIVLVLGLYWRKKVRLHQRRIKELESHNASVVHPNLGLANEDITKLKAALNEERGKIVRHEVQKKELLAYIEELKAMQGSTELRHKTIQIQRIFADQKSDDIVNKVENTARALYPNLVESLQAQYPDINRLELQYCMMLILGYNLDEIISVLGRSEKAIKSLRYRIRKKMNLDNTQSLSKFIKEIQINLSDN